MKTVNILNTQVAQVTYDSAIAQLSAWLKEDFGAVHSVVAANVHVVTEALISPEFRKAIDGVDMIVPDGMPLVWASRMLGSRLKDRCYGPTLMRKMLAQEDAAAVHYLYGSTESTLEKLAGVIRAECPKAVLAGMASPPFGDFVDDVELSNISAINNSGANLLWVGLGCPKQELWLHRYRAHLKTRVAVGVGAAFDFIAGVKPQAPGWMQNSGLEWLFRLGSEPGRLWKRYFLRNPYFVYKFALQLVRSRRRG